VAWGEINQAMQPEVFDRLAERFLDYLKDKKDFVEDLRAGADPTYQLSVRLISEVAWHALFAKQLFIRAENHDLRNLCPDFTIVVVPGFQADPLVDKVRSKAVIAINFKAGIILIGGTHYAGEIKKSIFTVLNYLLPQRGVLPMYCSANRGVNGETALFFGLSGTGKTTLSRRPRSPIDRRRRARLERRRDFQFRRRMLREVYSPFQGARATDLECNSAWCGPRERGSR
jgi:phosphoenolpyruvate carboxykinase (ATP)